MSGSGGTEESSAGPSSAEHPEAEPLLVTGLASGGEGVTRLPDGRVVFVEDSVPGDRVELGDLVVRKKLARARIARLAVASPDRVEPRCAHFGRCGGCSWQHVRYAAQLDAKRDIVCSALERIGRLALPEKIEVIGSPEPYAYRARARLVECVEGVGYRRRATREIEPVESCPILVPALQTALEELGQAVRSESADRGSEPGRRRSREVEWVVTGGTQGPAAIERLGRGRGQRSSRGPRSVEIEVLGEKLRVSAGSFVQANALLWDSLAGTVRDACTKSVDGEAAPQRFLELYAGIGFLSIPLARSGLSGVAIESDRSAVNDLERNLASAGLADRVEVIASVVERRGDLDRLLSRSDVLLADPPRAGLASEVRRAVASHGPRQVVYVSCDPATLARDLRELSESGYVLRELRILDLFPQTPHVESIAILARR